MIQSVIKPCALRPGQTVGLLASSGALPKPERLPLAVARLESLGYQVKVAESCTQRYGYLAGQDALRAECVNRMFRDDAVDAIFCVRGGYGATRILGLLDYDAISRNPKILTGYSDVTALHSAILARAGLVTFHGLMAVPDLSGNPDGFSKDLFFRILEDPSPIGPLANPPGFPREALVPGCAEGPLIGGNLSLVASCLGTPYAYDFEGAILFLEEVNEKPYAVDRLLTQLKNAGVFDRCAGVALGEFTDCGTNNPKKSLTLGQIFHDVLGSLSIPVLTGIRCGHVTPKLTLPLGLPCCMDAGRGTLEFPEGAVL